MFRGQKVLAIIPARGGSKGIKKKNIKMIAGKPLLVWTIEEAKKIDYIDQLVVSTDSEEIAKVTQECGVEIPFMRPVELATDTAKGIDVIKHCIDFYRNQFDYVLILQPTSPLRTMEDIERAFSLLVEKNAKAIVSVCELDHPFQWIGNLSSDMNMKNFTLDKYKNKNRQELRSYYRYNGAIYLSDINYLYNNDGFLGEETFALIMEKEKSVDIDGDLDFKIAEILLREKKYE